MIEVQTFDKRSETSTAQATGAILRVQISGFRPRFGRAKLNKEKNRSNFGQKVTLTILESTNIPQNPPRFFAIFRDFFSQNRPKSTPNRPPFPAICRQLCRPCSARYERYAYGMAEV